MYTPNAVSASLKAGLRQLEEGPCAMRQAARSAVSKSGRRFCVRPRSIFFIGRAIRADRRPLSLIARRRRQAMLLLARHFTERAVMPIGQEHRVVAEALVATRRPDQSAVHAGFEILDVTVRPGDAQGRDEMRPAALGRCRAEDAQLLFDGFH